MIRTLIIFFLLCTPVYGLTKTFSPTAVYSGYIWFTPIATYTGYEDVDGVVGRNTSSGVKKATFMTYDTSVMPVTSIITQIDLDIDVGNCQSSGAPSAWVNAHYLGHMIIDENLTTDEYNIWKGTGGEGGGWVKVHSKITPTDETVTICNTQASCHELINVNGDTDWAIFDESLYFIGGEWQCVYGIQDSRYDSEITVTYTVGVIQDAIIQDAVINTTEAKK